MDRRSWPWKKKSSDKAVIAADSLTASLSNSDGIKPDQDTTKTVQISIELYTHLTELEDQVKALNEKLLAAETEITTKENLVKQHAKVAEEAVSGWEKAEAEAAALQRQLESVTLLKLTAEERAFHLDEALKECMNQIRNVKEESQRILRSVKEESEQKLHDVVFAKTKQWEKAKGEMEAKIVIFEQELLKASAENSALSRTLQERSNILMKISDEKVQADAQVEVLKSNVQSCEKEINSLKYEVHVISKELEIRNEEKNMSIRSVEVTNKQHLEDVKKISKLEAECQRLRTLVRKKLPGPAALAQMKLEVENLSCDYGETRVRRSRPKSPGPHHFSTAAPDFLQSLQQFQKDNEMLTARLLDTEEEMKMLKEALAQRNSELQASRNLCARTTSELHSMEAQMLTLNQHKSPSVSNIDVPLDIISSSRNQPSLISVLEDRTRDGGSSSESWATALMSKLSQFKKQEDAETFNKVDDENHLELMDDFLEMEKLACSSTESNGVTTITDSSLSMIKSEVAYATALPDVLNKEASKNQFAQGESESSSHSTEKQNQEKFASDITDSPLVKLKSRIATYFDFIDQNVDVGKVLEDIGCIMLETQENLPHDPVNCSNEESHSTRDSWDKNNHDEMAQTKENGLSTEQENCLWYNAKDAQEQEIKTAISKITKFIMSLVKEGTEEKDKPSNYHAVHEKVDQFSSYVEKVLNDDASLMDFVLIVADVLSEVSELSCFWPTSKGKGESNISDCIDKVTLLENKVIQNEPEKENYLEVSSIISRQSSHPESDVPIGDNVEAQPTIQKCILEEYEQMKLEKETMEMNLSSYTEALEETKYLLVQSEQKLAELKSQLAASNKSNSLAETQLKCMAESYKVLESHSQELETQVNLLRATVETLQNELQEERHMHQENLGKYKDLQEQFESYKIEKYPDIDTDVKTQQEKEVAAAAQKLVECQDTMLLLSKQLQALRPQAEQLDSSPNGILLNDLLELPSLNSSNLQDMQMNSGQSDIEEVAALKKPISGAECSFEEIDTRNSPSEIEVSSVPRSPFNSKHPMSRSSSSSSSSVIPNTTPEKHGRNFSRFFSKGRK